MTTVIKTVVFTLTITSAHTRTHMHSTSRADARSLVAIVVIVVRKQNTKGKFHIGKLVLSNPNAHTHTFTQSHVDPVVRCCTL